MIVRLVVLLILMSTVDYVEAVEDVTITWSYDVNADPNITAQQHAGFKICIGIEPQKKHDCVVLPPQTFSYTFTDLSEGSFYYIGARTLAEVGSTTFESDMPQILPVYIRKTGGPIAHYERVISPFSSCTYQGLMDDRVLSVDEMRINVVGTEEVSGWNIFSDSTSYDANSIRCSFTAPVSGTWRVYGLVHTPTGGADSARWRINEIEPLEGDGQGTWSVWHNTQNEPGIYMDRLTSSSDAARERIPFTGTFEQGREYELQFVPREDGWSISKLWFVNTSPASLPFYPGNVNPTTEIPLGACVPVGPSMEEHVLTPASGLPVTTLGSTANPWWQEPNPAYGNQIECTFTLSSAQSGINRIALLANAEAGNADSFFVQVNDEPTQIHFHERSAENGVQWDFVNDQESGSDPALFDIPNGATVLHLFGRESGTKAAGPILLIKAP